MQARVRYFKISIESWNQLMELVYIYCTCRRWVYLKKPTKEPNFQFSCDLGFSKLMTTVWKMPWQWMGLESGWRDVRCDIFCDWRHFGLDVFNDGKTQLRIHSFKEWRFNWTRLELEILFCVSNYLRVEKQVCTQQKYVKNIPATTTTTG